MKIYTADKETGTFIDECKDIQEAKKIDTTIRRRRQKRKHLYSRFLRYSQRISRDDKTINHNK